MTATAARPALSVIAGKPSRRTKARAMRKSDVPGYVPETRVLARDMRQISNGLFALVVILTTLSLWHFAKGVALITGENIILATMFAVAIEAGYLGIEYARVRLPAQVTRPIRFWMLGAIIGLLAFSALMNVIAFTAQAESEFDWAIGAGFGVAVPALIFTFAHIGAKIRNWRNQTPAEYKASIAA